MMRVPDMILASAVYLCVKDANGSVRPAGTGFFLTIESTTRENISHGLKGTESPDPGSCSKFVFVDEPAQHIPPLDTQAIGGLTGRIRPRVRRPEIETAVGPLGIVVSDIDPKSPLQMAAAEHQCPV